MGRNWRVYPDSTVVGTKAMASSCVTFLASWTGQHARKGNTAAWAGIEDDILSSVTGV